MLETVAVMTNRSRKTDHTVEIKPGRIKRTELSFETGEWANALTLTVTVVVSGVEHTYVQQLGTTYAHHDHRSEHTHNQITDLMNLCRVKQLSSVDETTVLVLFKEDKIFGFTDVEHARFCIKQDIGPILVWDE